MITDSKNPLYKNMSQEDMRIINKGKELLIMEYDLIAKLRKDRELTQKELAEIMEIRQSAISQIENQEDVLVKTLERYIQALGGELELRAKFPDRVVSLSQFKGKDLASL
ncbi:MAG TPA: XRE family transcriptional regulator [Trueperaceae bacterium]|nr:XRE family transcriptional regulator [Trueperaceae bacterium]